MLLDLSLYYFDGLVEHVGLEIIERLNGDADTVFVLWFEVEIAFDRGQPRFPFVVNLEVECQYLHCPALNAER